MSASGFAWPAIFDTAEQAVSAYVFATCMVVGDGHNVGDGDAVQLEFALRYALRHYR